MLGRKVTALEASNGVCLDMLSAAVLYVLGKMVSNMVLAMPQDVSWLSRWFTCGLLDGLSCHYWFYHIQVFPARPGVDSGHCYRQCESRRLYCCVEFCRAVLTNAVIAPARLKPSCVNPES